MNATNASFLNDDGTPNVSELSNMFNRCGPVVAGGLAWLDNTRFCRWPNQSTDGKKHDVKGDPKGAAIPFDGASDVRPFIVDDIINERAAMKTTAFWHARIQPGASNSEEGNYATALLEHLIFRLMYYDLVREVELSAQYEEHYGWMVLAPRWRRELGMKRKSISLAEIQQAAMAVQQQQQQQMADGSSQMGEGIEPQLLQLAELPALIADPTMEAQAVDVLLNWYDRYVQNELPADMQDKVPSIKKSTVTQAVRDLRSKGTASVPIAYLAKEQPEVSCLKPWDEVFIPPELTTEQEIVFQVERVHESELRNRIITDGYDAAWVEQALKYKGAVTVAPLEIRATPIGIGGLTAGGTTSPVFAAQPTMNNTLVEIVHAIYRATDADGVPTIYCTTFHKQISETNSKQVVAGQGYGKHEEVEGAGSELPYAAGVREWWCRSITASRGVPERAHTTQNIIKGVLDSIIDRANITALPPVNVYESPTGAAYRFGPAVQNYVRQGREPKFMETPSGQGLNESVEVLQAVTKMKDNSYGLMSEDVPQPRLQMSQAMAVQRFLMTWNKALQQVVALCRLHMTDEDFSEITGAPAGWLDAHRDDEDSLDAALMFDVRELDPELMMKRIETMNNIALPNDVLGTINRAQWAGDMVRAIMGPLAAKRLVQDTPDASQALHDKANLEVLKMFAGNPPNFIDKNDPTAASLLQAVQQIVTQNPTYLRSLTDDALAAVAGQQAGQLAQQLGQRNPDPRFSELLTKYLQNLQFIGVTQPQNAQVGRIGVNPQVQQAAPQMQIKQPLAPPQMM
jgi:hypothetical protein